MQGRRDRVALAARASSHPALLAAALASAATTLGCYSVPAGRRAVSSVRVEGTRGIDRDDLRQHIATRPSARFLGLVRGFVYDYELFDRHALRRDLARVERYLQARGYYDAKVRAARVVRRGDQVDVTIEVSQGPPVVVRSVAIRGADALAPDVRADVREAVATALREGDTLDEVRLAEAEKAATRALLRRGHAAAKVARHAEVDLATESARVSFDVTPGPVARVGVVRFEGLGELPAGAVRRVFGVSEGDPYSIDDIEEGQRALLDLSLFASVGVDQDLSELDATGAVPITVRTEPSKLRALLVGGGFELDSLKTDVHGLVGWQSGNFLGGLRRFEIRESPGVVLFPTRFPTLQPPTDPLFENRLIATLRQPALFEARTTGVSRAEYNIYPVLLPKQGTDVVGYHEVRGTVGVERWFRRFFLSPQYGIQANFPFTYLGRPPDVSALLLSYIDVFGYLDLRDDPLHTTKGLYVGADAQVAGGPLQGDATDLRVQPEARGYVPLAKNVTLAVRASVGFLFPSNYGRYAEQSFLENPTNTRGTTASPDFARAVARDEQILFFRGFFSGGATSNRGYPLRGIGPHAVIPVVSPAGQSVTASGCDPNEPCLLPTGGLSIWEASAELRVGVSGPFSTALFCDASDVSPFRLDIRLDRPHLSCGAGARYDTPVGPLRLDVGYRLPGPLQYPKNASGEVAPDTLLGVPIALAFGIGEAF